MDKYSLYGVDLCPMSKAILLEKLCKALEGRKQICVFTPNLQMLGSAAKDKRLAGLLNSADILLPDGVGIHLAAKRSGYTLPDKMTGIDTAYSLLRYASVLGYRVFLLGGGKGVAESARKNLKKQLPALCVCGTHHGYFDKRRDSPQNREVLKKIQKARPDILFVCFGFPLQEIWIKQNASALTSVRLLMGLGGSLDVWSGKTQRAPKAFQRMNLEWMWRCIREPKRILPLVKNLVTVFLSELS